MIGCPECQARDAREVERKLFVARLRAVMQVLDATNGTRNLPFISNGTAADWAVTNRDALIKALNTEV